ncbi:MAG: chromophore lyase CpcT/CpeT [Rhodospirillaceae bacterium]|nr:chromophore lyase CpcT/CpeT [Rhodospirillaceae bacterium]
MRILFAALISLAFAAPAHAHTKADFDAQLKLLSEWLPGDYDNNEQIVRQSGGGLAVTKTTPFFRVHTIIKRVAMPEIGEHVFYLEEYRDNDPAKITRIRLYKFTVDIEAQAIRLHLLNPLKPEVLVGAHSDLAKVEALKLADMRADRDLCDVFIRWEGNQFRGAMKPKSCDRPDKTTVDYTLTIGPKHHWTRNRARDAKNNVVWEFAPGAGEDFVEGTKARWFSCGIQESADGDMTKTKPYKTITLHDQGGEAAVPWPDGRTLVFVIHDRAFTSPPDREFPLFRIHDQKNMTVPIAYAYAVDEAERFGLNLGWFYIRCQVQK